MFALSKAADLNWLVKGGQLYWPFQQGFPDKTFFFIAGNQAKIS